MKKPVSNDTLNTKRSESIINYIKGFAITISLLIGTTVIFGWYFEKKEILSIIPGSATMKFNTALVFLITGILLSIQNTKKQYTLYFITYWLAPLSLLVFLLFWNI